MENITPASTFGHIYRHALQVQLGKIGSKLRTQRLNRRHSLDYVAAALGLRPETLEQIETGQRDCRIKTLFALCNHYNIDIDSIIGQGELIRFKVTLEE